MRRQKRHELQTVRNVTVPKRGERVRTDQILDRLPPSQQRAIGEQPGLSDSIQRDTGLGHRCFEPESIGRGVHHANRRFSHTTSTQPRTR